MRSADWHLDLSHSVCRRQRPRLSAPSTSRITTMFTGDPGVKVPRNMMVLVWERRPLELIQ